MRHEIHLARAGFASLAVVAAGAGMAGAVLGGRPGAASGAIGVGLVAANHALAVASTAWSRKLGLTVVAVGYAAFVLRMVLVLAAFGSLQTLGWIHSGLLAVSFSVALVVSLTAECLSYARGTYVPSWRMR